MPAVKLPLGRLGLFAALSAADLALTLFLIGRTQGVVYESNPLAGWWLDRHGWLGLAAFKVGLVGLVGVVTVLLARRRPRAAGRLLGFGCGAVAVVVLYSCSLARAYVTGANDEAFEIQRLVASSEHLSSELEKGDRYRDVLQELSREAGAGTLDLAAGVARLRQTEKAHDPAWLDQLRVTDDLTDDECLAANIISFTVSSLRAQPDAARAAEDRLAAQFQDRYDHTFPKAGLGFEK
jgi:hypothetical protein